MSTHVMFVAAGMRFGRTYLCVRHRNHCFYGGNCLGFVSVVSELNRGIRINYCSTYLSNDGIVPSLPRLRVSHVKNVCRVGVV